MAILWEGLKDTLDTPKHDKLKSRLVAAVTQFLPLLFNELTVRINFRVAQL